MAEIKTKKTNLSVSDFIASIPDDSRRKDAKEIMKMMKESTGQRPKLWGTSIVGYGDLHYKYASGREGDWFVQGFSPRKDSFTIYLCGGLDKFKEELKTLGKYKTGVGCLYFKKLDDLDRKVLRKILDRNARRSN